MKYKIFLFAIAAACCCCKPSASGQSAGQQDSVYTYQQASADGTGKFYKGREIAQVMGFDGAEWLERNTRQQEENVNLAIKKLPVTAGSTVADIGAGTGYYTFRIAPKVSNGKVYAVELQSDAINYLNKKSTSLKQNNITVVKGIEQSPNLPESSTDLAIMVDVYHELAYPHEYLQALRRSLKADGKLLLIEYRGEDKNLPIKALHKTTVEQISKELTANGFHLIQNGQFLKIQHFLVFQKN